MADEIRRLSDDLARDPSSLLLLLADALRRAGQLDLALRGALRGLDRHPYVADAHDVLARFTPTVATSKAPPTSGRWRCASTQRMRRRPSDLGSWISAAGIWKALSVGCLPWAPPRRRRA
jgi:hypothetical protein